MSLFDVNSATSIIQQAAGAEANVIFGAVVDPSMKDQMRVTVIATGFGSAIESVHHTKEEAETEIVRSEPGKVMSLFPEESAYPARKAAAGGNNGGRGRTPAFEDDNRQIPAYIRRLEEN